MTALGAHGTLGGKRTLSLVVFCIALWGCHQRPTPYRVAMLEAEQARRDGDFDEERRKFAEASRLAKRDDDADEARYRRAQSHSREEHFERAAKELESLARTYPESNRAARAWLDAGRNWERCGELERALFAFRQVVARYGNSGSAMGAASRVVVLRGELETVPEHVAWRALLTENGFSELDEGLRYHYALALEEIAPEKALLAHEDVARKHPPPRGSYSDDALLHAGRIRLRLGDPEGAFETLGVLRDQGGRAAILGSYVRTTYVEAMFLQGLILRDNLQRPEEAMATFRLVAKKYPESRLVDDALWEIVKTENALGGDSCRAMTALENARPDSRFVRCSPLLCDGQITEPRHRSVCEGWLSPSAMK